jgi:3-deoxy-manno-octulosonate cytidylyltransferase (CMP-KDO synthetase)
MKVLAVIPARWKSSRFPGKPIALIKGKPMIYLVWKQVIKSKSITDCIVATDDKRISNICKKMDIKVMITSKKHLTGTDRLYEVSKRIKSDIYVNIQGDEPLINPKSIDAVINLLKKSLKRKIFASTAYVKIPKNQKKELTGVYLVCNKQNEVLYLSRYPITSNFKEKIYKKKHIGIYAFTKDCLKIFSKLKFKRLELSESIEILRLIENGYTLISQEVNTPLIDVNYPNDIKKVENFLTKKIAKRIR